MFKSMYDVKKDTFKICPEMESMAADSIIRTWNNIAGDCFECSDTLSRAEVIELVMDANRLEDNGMEAAAYAIWAKWFSPTSWKRIIKMSLPYKSYGN